MGLFDGVESRCSSCILYTLCENPHVMGVGNADNPDVMFVLDYVGVRDDKEDDLRKGISCKIVDQVAKKLQLSQDDYYVTAAIKCCPGKESRVGIPSKRACKTRLVQEIAKVKPKKIVALGGPAAWAVCGSDKVTKMRTADLPGYHGIPVFVTYSPHAVRRDETVRNVFFQDIERAVKNSKAVDPSELDYTILTNTKEIKTALTGLLKNVWAAFDIETVGLDPHADRARLLTIAFSTAPRTGFGFSLKKSEIGALEYSRRIKLLNKVFAHRKCPKLIAHNGKFDGGYLWKFGVKAPVLGWDTQLAHFLLDEEYAFPALKELALRYTDLGNYDSNLQGVKGTLDKVPIDDVITYNIFDADATYRIFQWEKERLEEHPGMVWVLEKVMLPASYALMRMELNGVYLDDPHIEKTKREYEVALAEVDSKLLRSKYARKIAEHFKTPFNPNSADHIRYLVYTLLKCPVIAETGTGMPSTSKDVLEQLSKRHKSLSLFVKRSKYEKMLSTYLRPTKGWYSEDGKVHTQYNLVMARTGRLCVSGDTVLDTTFGKFRIDGLDLTEYPECAVRTHKGRVRKILRKFYKGEEEMYEVKTKTGAVIRCTAGHRFMKRHGWESLSSLSVGESIKMCLAPKLFSHSLPDERAGFFEYSEIVSIEPVGVQGVWDIEVEEDHSYVAQGFVNHNSSTRPNSQNIPREKAIKKIIRPREGNNLIQLDYSQVELRVIACAAKDERLIHIYREGLDAHRMAASAMFNVEYDAVTGEQRQEAKGAVSFGLNYGRAAKALAADLGIPEEDAVEFRRSYFEKYSGVHKYIGKTKKRAKRDGYIDSLFGRRRRLPYLNSSDSGKRGQAERQAVNHTIQSTASDIMLMALYRIQRMLEAKQSKAKLIFSVHDSALIDCPSEEVDEVALAARHEMETFEFPWLIVPLVSDIEVMNSWGDTIREL